MAGNAGDRFGCRPAQALRKLLIAVERQGFMIDHIAAEQFIGPFSGKNDLDMFRGFPVDKIEGCGRGIRKGLIHIILDPGELLPVLLCRNDLAVVFNTDLFRERLRVGDLVVGLVVKADRKGLCSAEVGGDIGRIHAAGQE